MAHFPSREEFITLEAGKLRRADVWLDQRAWETIFHLKEQRGATISQTVRVALEVLRRQIGIDQKNEQQARPHSKVAFIFISNMFRHRAVQTGVGIRSAQIQLLGGERRLIS
jgi:hypothetical protein